MTFGAHPSRAHGTCASCGYDLTGLRAACCPECGRDPAVPPRPGAAWFANTILAACLVLTALTGLFVTRVDAYSGPAVLACLAQWALTLFLGLATYLRIIRIQQVAQHNQRAWRSRALLAACARISIAILALAGSVYMLKYGGAFDV